MKLSQWCIVSTLCVSLLVIPRADASSDVARGTAVSHISCSVAEQAALATTISDATTYATQASTYFSQRRAGARFTYWFGAYDAGRWNTVKQNYDAIRVELVAEAIEFDCSLNSCSAQTYGFVYPTDTRPLTIHLCDVFWSAPNTGTDSRAGSLFHWLSQFSSLGSTVTRAYGQSSSHALPPEQAIANSDNYEYFAENTPNTPDNAGAFTVNTVGHNFGNQTVATTSATQEFIVANTGDTALAVTALTVTGDFAIASDTCRSGVVAVNASCTVAVTFNPQADHSSSGILTIATNAVISTANVTLSGTGVAAVPTTTAAPVSTSTTLVATSTTSTTAPATTTTTSTPVAVATVRPTTVSAKATSGGSRLTVRIGLVSEKTARKFVVQVKRGAKWVSLASKYSTSRTTATKVIDLPKGQYRVVVSSAGGFAGATSKVIRLLK